MEAKATAKLSEEELRSYIITLKEAGNLKGAVLTYDDWRQSRENRLQSAHTYFHIAHCHLMMGWPDTASYYEAQMIDCKDYTQQLTSDYLADLAIYYLGRGKIKKAESSLYDAILCNEDPQKTLRNRMIEGRIKLFKADRYAVDDLWAIYEEFVSLKEAGEEIDETIFLNNAFWLIVACARFPHQEVDAPLSSKRLARDLLAMVLYDIANGEAESFTGNSLSVVIPREHRAAKLDAERKIAEAHTAKRWLMANYGIYRKLLRR